MGVTKNAIYPKSASQICYKESNFIFASSCFGTHTHTQKHSKNTIVKTFKYNKNMIKSLAGRGLMLWLFVGPTGVYLLDFFCSGIQFNLLLSPYPCFISLLYLDLYVLGDDALIS